jgi:hypothetical protein
MNWIVIELFPTPPDPNTTTLYLSVILFIKNIVCYKTRLFPLIYWFCKFCSLEFWLAPEKKSKIKIIFYNNFSEYSEIF